MPDPHPLMTLMLQGSSFVGQTADVEDVIMPLPEQFAFGIGDAGVLAASDTPLEKDFAVVRGIDPERYAALYPDWEDRIHASYVLCEHFSREDPEISIGWHSRLKILPITQYRYKECRRWLKHGFPEDIPEWVTVYYRKYTDALSEHAPDRVPKAVECPECGSREVQLRVVRKIAYMGHAGQVNVEDKIRYVPLSEIDTKDTHVSQLKCTNEKCGVVADLEDDEWDLPGISR